MAREKKEDLRIDWVDQQFEEEKLEDEIKSHVEKALRSITFFKIFQRPVYTHDTIDFMQLVLKNFTEAGRLVNMDDLTNETKDVAFYLQDLYRQYEKLSDNYPNLKAILTELDHKIQNLQSLLMDARELEESYFNENVFLNTGKNYFAEDGTYYFNNKFSFRIKQVLVETTALFQIMNYAISENKNGNPDFLQNLSPKQIPIILSGLIPGLEKSDSMQKMFFEGGNTIYFVSMIKDEEFFSQWMDKQNKDLGMRMCMKGRFAVSEDVKTLLSEMKQDLEGSGRLNESAKACLSMLDTFPIINPDENGKVSDETIHWVCRLIACRQLMLKDVPEDKKYSKLPDDQYEEQISSLTLALEKSKMIQSALKSDDALKNAGNLLDILKHSQEFAKRLNDLPPEQKASEEEVLENTKQDISLIFKQEEEEALYLSQLEDGYYDVDSKSFADTKKKMSVLGQSLAKLAEENQIFKVTDKIEDADSKALETIKESITKLAVLLNEQSQKGFAKIKLDMKSGLSPIMKSAATLREKEDYENLKEITDLLDQIEKNCQAVLVNGDSFDNSQDFMKVYSGIISARKQIDAITFGNLLVPGEGIDYENGHKIHRLVCSDNGLNSDILNADIQKIIDFENEMELSFDGWEGNKEPLFSHDPCPSDIVQGEIGDCYFVSTLAAVAARNPQVIRNMMTYNENDDTVTVRFYKPNNDPIYVTVDNTIPMMNYKTTDLSKNEITGQMPAFSRGARWVALMEKAYIASGLVNEYGSKREENKASIHRGFSGFVMNMMFGPEVGKYSEADVMEHKDFKIQPANEPIFPKEYKKEDIEFYNKIKNLYQAGHPLTCGTGVDSIDRAELGVDPAGLPQNHSYGIIGFTEENGAKYIYVKNPHAKEWRGYDEQNKPVRMNLLNAKDKKDQLGVSKLELRDFLNNFRSVTTADFKRRPIEITQEIVIEKYKLLYEETIRDMNQIINYESEDSDQLDDLKYFTNQALNALNNRKTQPDELNYILTNYFDAARSYLDFRDKAQRSEEDEKDPNAAGNYFAASIIRQLGICYFRNEMKGLDHALETSSEELFKEVLRQKETDSRAKKASTEYITEQKEKRDAYWKLQSFEGMVIRREAGKGSLKIGKNIVLSSEDAALFTKKGTTEYTDVKKALEKYTTKGSDSISEIRVAEIELRKNLYNAAKVYLLKKDTKPSLKQGQKRVAAAARIMAQTAVDLLQTSQDEEELKALVQDMKVEILRSKVFRDCLTEELPELVKSKEDYSRKPDYLIKTREKCGQIAAQLCAFTLLANTASARIKRKTILPGIMDGNEANQKQSNEIIEGWDTKVKKDGLNIILSCKSSEEIRSTCSLQDYKKAKEEEPAKAGNEPANGGMIPGK